jgi:hypothetical protein
MTDVQLDLQPRARGSCQRHRGCLCRPFRRRLFNGAPGDSDLEAGPQASPLSRLLGDSQLEAWPAGLQGPGKPGSREAGTRTGRPASGPRTCQIMAARPTRLGPRRWPHGGPAVRSRWLGRGRLLGPASCFRPHAMISGCAVQRTAESAEFALPHRQQHRRRARSAATADKDRSYRDQPSACRACKRSYHRGVFAKQRQCPCRDCIRGSLCIRRHRHGYSPEQKAVR